MLALVLVGCSGPRPIVVRQPTTPTEPAPPGTEDVLLVLLDDLGVGQVDAPGAPPTPTLDALAAQGTTFRNAWVTALCSPTRASLLTGRYPTRTGVGMVDEFIGVAPGSVVLALSERTIPEMLASAPVSWDTSFVGKWHVGGYLAGAERDPGEQGFAWYAGTVGNLDQPDNLGDYFHWTKDDNGVLAPRDVYATTDSADDAIARMNAMSEPWFLYLAFHAPHEPYHFPPATLADTSGITDVAGEYRAMITAVDAELGRVLASMDPAKRARTTAIVLGDNGMPDDLALPNSDRVKFTLYEGGVHVPLIVAGPRVAVPGSRTDALVDVTDFFATVADIAGADPGDVDGRSFLPVLADPAARVRDTAYTELFWDDTQRTWAIRDTRYKLLVTEDWRYGPPGTETATQLFDLWTDPRETVDLSHTPEGARPLARLSEAAAALQARIAP